MQDPSSYREVFTSIIKKQMMLLGPQVVLSKIQNINGLKVAEDGTVISITKSPDDILEQIFSLFMDFPGRVAAKEIISAKSAQAKQVKEQIAGGWLQIENEKAQLVAALEGIPFGFITTNDGLEITNKNGMVEKILGISEDAKRGWSLNEMQQHIKDQFYLPIECNKAMESKAAVPPVDVTFDKRRLRFFISPIIQIDKQVEVSGVTILIEYLGPAVAAAPPPAQAQPAA